MRIGLIAPPLIPVPPADYGGTELLVAHLASALQKLGVEVVVYANAESTVPVKRRSIYERAEWPIKDQANAIQFLESCSAERNFRQISRCGLILSTSDAGK